MESPAQSVRFKIPDLQKGNSLYNSWAHQIKPLNTLNVERSLNVRVGKGRSISVSSTKSNISSESEDKGPTPKKERIKERSKTTSKYADVKVFSWGDGSNGKLGLGNDNQADEPTQIVVFGKERINCVACGTHNSAFVGENSSFYMCGLGKTKDNSSSILGAKEDKIRVIPFAMDVSFPRQIKEVAIGTYHVIVLTEAGLSYTWGSGKNGQLGHGDFISIYQPKQLQLETLRKVAAGNLFTMVVTKFGELYSFGSNKNGELGLGALTERNNTPRRVKKLPYVRTVSCGVNRAAVVTGKKDTDVYVWGKIYKSVSLQTLPIKVEKLQNLFVIQVSCAESHFLALTQTGHVYWWDDGITPLRIVQLTGFHIKQIAAGCNHFIALDDDGKIYTWGHNTLGQLGKTKKPGTANPTDLNCPERLESLSSHYVSQITCGNNHSVVVVNSNQKKLDFYNLLKSERSYIIDLDVIELYMKGDQDEKEKVMTEEFKADIFRNTSEILLLHREMLNLLDEAIANQPCPETAEMFLLDIFQRKITDFDIYLYYADTYPSAASILQKEKKSAKLATYFETQESKARVLYAHENTPPKKFDLKNLLIEPLKHIARYAMFLKKLLRVSANNKDIIEVIYENYKSLLRRLISNMELVDPFEILSCTLNEFGHPEIGGGELKKLVDRLTSHQFIDQEFSNAFFLTYRLFTNASDVLSLLEDRFDSKPRRKSSTNSTNSEDYLEIQRMIRMRVLQVIHQWIKSPYSSYDFDNITLVNEVLKLLDKWNYTDLSQQITNIKLLLQKRVKSELELKVQPVPNELPERDSAPHLAMGIKAAAMQSEVYVNLTSIDVEAISEYISLVDFEYFRKIEPREFLKQAWTKPNKEDLAPNLVAANQRSNQLSQWITYEILCKQTSKERAQVLSHLIAVAKNLLKMNNYMGMVCVMGGLTSSCVVRLKKTFQKLSPRSQSDYDKLSELISGARNFQQLRAMAAKAEPPCIPLLAITMKDLISADEGNPDRLADGQINFFKWRKISEVIHEAIKFQLVPYEFKGNHQLECYVYKNKLIAIGLGDDGLYRVSKKCE